MRSRPVACALLLAACGPSSTDSSTEPVRDSAAPPAPTTTTTTSSFSCFTGETRVDTPRGAVPIGELEVGDTVWSVDPRTGRRAERPVAWVHTHGPEVGLDLDVAGRTIRTTASHPFWVPSERTYVPAGELSVGDELLVLEGKTRTLVPVQGLTSVRRDEPVYDLNIDGEEHTFLAEGLLVHNKWYATPFFSTTLAHAAPNLPEATVRVWDANAPTGTVQVQETVIEPLTHEITRASTEPEYQLEIAVDGTVIYSEIHLSDWYPTQLALVEGSAGPQILEIDEPDWPIYERHYLQVVNGVVDGGGLQVGIDTGTTEVAPGAHALLTLDPAPGSADVILDALPVDGVPELTVRGSFQVTSRSTLLFADERPQDGTVDTVYRWTHEWNDPKTLQALPLAQP